MTGRSLGVMFKDPVRRSVALVVEDEPLIAMEAVDLLEEGGFRVLEAWSADQALKLLEENGPVTLLFTDVHMPGGADGFELARRTAKSWPHIAVVVASGNAKPGPGDLPEGATFIGKPFSAEIVRHHVRKTLPDEKQPEPLRT